MPKKHAYSGVIQKITKAYSGVMLSPIFHKVFHILLTKNVIHSSVGTDYNIYSVVQNLGDNRLVSIPCSLIVRQNVVRLSHEEYAKLQS